MNSNYEIVVDSTADLNREQRIKYAIFPEDIRCLVYINGKEEFADCEWKNYTPEEFFKIVKKNVGEVKTAFGTYEEFCRVLEPILKAGKDAMVFALSGGLSGTVNGFRNFANILLEEYPERKIEIIDTLKYSTAVGLLAIYSAQKRKEGMSFEDNIEYVNHLRYCLREIGPLDDLRFLAKNGRLSAGKAFFGSLVGVQPVSEFNRAGKTEPLGTLKGDDAVNKFCLEYILKFAKDIDNQIVIIDHSTRPDRAELFKKQLLEHCSPKEVIVTHVGQSCGPNMGPGLCAYFFLGDELSEDRKEEMKFFEDFKKNSK